MYTIITMLYLLKLLISENYAVLFQLRSPKITSFLFQDSLLR